MSDHILPEDEMHEKFKENVLHGRPGELETIKVLKYYGHNPVDLKKETAEYYKDRWDYRDSGDILLPDEGGRIVESKRLRINFTRAFDYKYDSVMVERVWKFHEKPIEPYVYYIWSCDLKYYILVYPAKVKDKFRSFSRRDSITTQRETAYTVGKGLCEWRKNPCR